MKLQQTVVPAAALLFTLAGAAPSPGFGTAAAGCGADCTACHKMSRDEAATVIRELDAGTTVESVAPAPVRGLYQVVVKKGTETGIIYLDFSGKYLISGRVIDTKHKKDMTAVGLEELRHLDPATLPQEDALVLGNRKGTRNLYVFTDPECPFCASLHGELVALTKEDPQLKVSIFLTPLDIHPGAAAKTDAILCAAKKNMGEGLRLLGESFGGSWKAASGCGVDYAGEGKKRGRDLGIGVTPTMIFDDGRVVTGVRSAKEIRKLLDAAGKTATASHG